MSSETTAAPRPARQFGCIRLVLVVEADLAEGEHADGWSPGPYPFPASADATLVAGRSERAKYFHPRVCDALYDDRWHRSPTDAERSASPIAELEVDALELVRFRAPGKDPDGLFVVHTSVDAGISGDDLVKALSRASLLEERGAGADPELRGWHDRLLGNLGTTSSARRATTIALVTPAGQTLATPAAASQLPWSWQDQWLWFLASATPYTRYPPDPADRDKLLGGQISFSATWRALVLRDGTAFLGCEPDRGEETSYYRAAELFVRSIYLDALLLGIIQRITLSEIADDVAGLKDPVSQPKALRVIEQDLTNFRNVFWWQHLTYHGFGNELLAAYQQQHGLDPLREQIVEELAEYSRQAERLAAEKTNALLALLTILGATFGLAFGITQSLGVESTFWVLISMGIALVAAVVAGFLPVTRSLLRPLFEEVRGSGK